MNKLLVLLAIMFSVSNSFANSKTNYMESIKDIEVLYQIKGDSRYTRRGNQGCCSWHGGVAGCDAYTGRLICADGTLSPTCTC